MTLVQDDYVELRGLRFHYRDWACENPDAQTLVMLHGYTGHARSWDRLAEDMCRDYRVLALDQRGHGESAWASPAAYGTFQMVDDLAAFVAALGLDRFVLLGLSMGGSVSITYAGRRPPELERLVIVDIAPEIVRSGASRIADENSDANVFDSPDAAFAKARRENSRPPEDHHFYRVRNSLMRTEDGRWTYRYDPVLRDMGSLRPGPTVDEGWRNVENISVPTLLVRGEHSDILSAEIAERMVSSMADCRLVEVRGAGHPIPLDAPDAFLRAVRTFL